jgi:hypothetical protein
VVTRAQLRTSVKRRLADTGLTPLYADGDLNAVLEEAVALYDSRVPKQATTTAAVAADANQLAPPAGVEPAQVVRLLDGRGAVIPKGELHPGPAPAEISASLALEWSPFAGALLFSRKVSSSEAGTFTLHALTGRELPTNDVDDAQVLPGDELAVSALAAALFLQRRATDDAKRDRRGPPELRRLADELTAEWERHVRRHRQVQTGTLSR